jgi:hypothetical protein
MSGLVSFNGVAVSTAWETTQFVATPMVPIHTAIGWDVDGINGTADTVRVYRDGVLIGSATGVWNPVAAPLYDLVLGFSPDSGGYDKYISDNIKVWNYAKTDFADRFVEGYDNTAPVITPHITGTAGSNGWYVGPVSVSWSVVDDESPVTAQNGCGPTTLTTDTAGITLTCSATSLGGSSSQAVTVKLDQTAPTIVAAATTSPNGTGWYNANVTVHFTCADSLAGVPAGACPADQVLSTEGAAVSATAQTVTDAAGNKSAVSNVVTVKIDKTAPLLNPVVSPNPVALNGVATAAANASDSVSGIAAQSCEAVNTSMPGAHTLKCAATNNAGLATTKAVTYFVSIKLLKQHVLANLTALRATVRDKQDGQRLDDAIRHLTQSLDAVLWAADGVHLQARDGERVFNAEKDAVNKLSEIIEDKRTTLAKPTLQKYVNSLVAADRALATVAIADAAGGDPRALAQATDELHKGDNDVTHGKLESGIEHYRNAWQHALRAPRR